MTGIQQVEDFFVRAMRERMKHAIELVANEELEEAKKRISARVPELAARLAVEVQSALDYKDMESIIQIRIDKSRLLR